MDLESQIANTFENRTYSDLFKIRWLYLYICELFSYDTRFIYADEKLKDEIYDKKIDIKNVEDFEIVCYTLSRILTDVLSSYGYECEIVRESVKENKFKHAYVVVKCDDYTLKLDPTKRHDLTRAKINSNTLDFTLLNDNSNFIEELKEADGIITNNYAHVDKEVLYDSEGIANIVKLADESVKLRNLSEAEDFYARIDYLFYLINSRYDLKRYDDVDYYFSYLIKKFKLNEKTEISNGKAVTTPIYRVKPGVFFNNDDKSMKDIINLTIIQYDKSVPPMMYLLKKEGENYKAREIFRDEAIELLKQYRNSTCQFTFESAAMNLQKEKKGKIVI